ncbi:corticotropin-releasing factor receptor 2-like [Anneissia japonica]|uniref:corticotropin-releasing factor receptor 2-like n=1 Tax=Anneissia japonica TaxID=1529436 RepID=UPI00142562E1|nr:corticotropin-releasing factor receptor 2-like [Anneissia japonica]
MDQCFKKCRDKFSEKQEYLIDNGIPFCEAMWDSTFCWPTTLANERTDMKCPDNFIVLDPEKTTFRDCGINGTWVPRIYIEDCLDANWKESMQAEDDAPVATKEQQKVIGV